MGERVHGVYGGWRPWKFVLKAYLFMEEVSGEDEHSILS